MRLLGYGVSAIVASSEGAGTYGCVAAGYLHTYV